MRTDTTGHTGPISVPAIGPFVDEVRVSTVVYAPREEVFAFLMDLRTYPKYSKHLRDVEREGDGGPGTRYTMTFGWWKVTYRAVSEVVAVDEPTSIDWRVVKDIDAEGYWQLTDAPEECPPDREHATRVELLIEYDPDSASAGAIDLPALVPLETVIDRAVGLIAQEAERVLERIVADLEGSERAVELVVHDSPDSI